MKANNAHPITLRSSLVPVVGLMAFGAMWLLGSETVTLLDKRLPSGDRVRVCGNVGRGRMWPTGSANSLL